MLQPIHRGHARCAGSGRALALVCLVLTLLVAGFESARAGEAFAFDAVNALRLSLRVPVHEGEQGVRDLRLRRRTLEARVAALTRLPDLREALLLPDWRDEDANSDVADIDRAVRAQVAERLENGLHDVFRAGNMPSRVAAINMVREVAVAMRGALVLGSVSRSFEADLADLCRSGAEPCLRSAAGQALAQLGGDPAVAARALCVLFESDDVALRRAASEAILSLALGSTQSIRRPNGTTVEPARGRVLALAQAVIPVVGGGLADPDGQVRRHSAESLQCVALAVAKQVREPRAGDGDDAPDADRPRQEDADGADLLPLAAQLKDQSASLSNALNDPDSEVRVAARRALEELATTSARLQGRPASAPVVTTVGYWTAAGEHDSALQVQPVSPVSDRIHAALPALAAGLNDRDVKARRAAIDALEGLGADAAALPALMGALHDKDRFVRWGAVRTLGKIPGPEAARAVPSLVPLLADPDFDVRLATADTLRRFGPAAEAAVPDLARAVGRGDAVMRLAAMQALEGIGLGARPAIPALADALSAPDARVRQAAAKLLGRFGPAAFEFEDVLRLAVNDPDPDVRRAVGDALLLIAPPGTVVGADRKSASAPGTTDGRSGYTTDWVPANRAPAPVVPVDSRQEAKAPTQPPATLGPPTEGTPLIIASTSTSATVNPPTAAPAPAEPWRPRFVRTLANWRSGAGSSDPSR
jgi:hypothetical protein